MKSSLQGHELAAFQRSRAGLFVKKVHGRSGAQPGGAAGLGHAERILPLILGVLSVAGLFCAIPSVLDQVYNTLLVLVPSQAAGPVGDALQGVREASAAPAGVVALVLLLYNGSSFFPIWPRSSIRRITSRAAILVERLVAVAMLVITTILLVVSTLAVGPGQPGRQRAARPADRPNPGQRDRLVDLDRQRLRSVRADLQGAAQRPAGLARRPARGDAVLGAAVRHFAGFPLYVVRFFPPNQAYAVFGVFLVFTFWLYLLGFVLVLGAELNAFLQEPSRSVALAEATAAGRTERRGTSRGRPCAPKQAAPRRPR